MPGSFGGEFSYVSGLQIFSYKGSCLDPEDTAQSPPTPAHGPGVHFIPAWVSQTMSQQCQRSVGRQLFLWPCLLLLLAGQLGWLLALVHSLVCWGLPKDPIANSSHCISPDGTAPLRRAGTVLGPAELPSLYSAEAARFYSISSELSFPTSRKNSKRSAEVQSVTLDFFSKLCRAIKLLSQTQTAPTVPKSGPPLCTFRSRSEDH